MPSNHLILCRPLLLLPSIFLGSVVLSRKVFNVEFPGGSVVKNLPANAGYARYLGLIPGLKNPLKKEMATHSSILAWEVSWTEKPGRLQSMESQKLEMT